MMNEVEGIVFAGGVAMNMQLNTALSLRYFVDLNAHHAPIVSHPMCPSKYATVSHATSPSCSSVVLLPGVTSLDQRA